MKKNSKAVNCLRELKNHFPHQQKISQLKNQLRNSASYLHGKRECLMAAVVAIYIAQLYFNV